MMEQTTLVHPSAFCWNPSCADYGKVDQGNIRRFGRTQAGTHRYQCRTCHRTFVDPIGTVFYGRRHTQETISECLALLAERNSLAAIDRVKRVKEETVVAWLRLAALHVERIDAILLANYRLTRAQLDAMWTYVGHKGEKGAARSRTIAAPSGAAYPWLPIRACGLGARSARPRRWSPTS
jgi:transposase-like protein